MTLPATTKVIRDSPERAGPYVANIKSQIKRNRQNLVRHERNKAVRSELKTRAKAAVAAAGAGEDDAETKLREAVSRIDTAAAKGVIHKNQAARRKARLLARVNEVAGEPSED